MKKSLNEKRRFLALIIFLQVIFLFPTLTFSQSLVGTWQHTESSEQIRFENKTFQNYDHIGYYVNVGEKGHNFYVGEDIVYLKNIGNNQYSGYTKMKWNMNQLEWLADTWTVNGNIANSTITRKWQKLGNTTPFYPNIAGTWYQNGNSNQLCYIQQNGQYLSFQLGENQSQGYFSSDKELYATSWNSAATLSNDYNTITWGNQTWSRKTTTQPTNYPNIAGTWYQNSNANQPCTINQNGKSLSFQLGSYTSQGTFNSVREVFASDWNSKGSLSADGNTITWSNQTWTRKAGSTPKTGQIDPNKYYRFVAGHSNKCLDLANYSKSNGANVQQWTCHNGDNQLWKLEALSDGYYRIISKTSRKVLDVEGASKNNGANIYQYDWHGGDNQKWEFKAVEDGYFRIISKNSGKVFDIKDKSTANGANLMQQYWAGAANPNQRWKLELISGGSTTGGVLETVKVMGASRSKVYSNIVLQEGTKYTLDISGTFSLWNSSDKTGADALYCYRPLNCPTPKLWSPLWINDKPLKEFMDKTGESTAYNSNHTYRVTIIGNGQKFGFGLRDTGAYGGNGNSGEIYVRISQ